MSSNGTTATRNGAVTFPGAGIASMLTESGIVRPGPPHPATASTSIATTTDHMPCFTAILPPLEIRAWNQTAGASLAERERAAQASDKERCSAQVAFLRLSM